MVEPRTGIAFHFVVDHKIEAISSPTTWAATKHQNIYYNI